MLKFIEPIQDTAAVWSQFTEVLGQKLGGTLGTHGDAPEDTAVLYESSIIIVLEDYISSEFEWNHDKMY